MQTLGRSSSHRIISIESDWFKRELPVEEAHDGRACLIDIGIEDRSGRGDRMSINLFIEENKLATITCPARTLPGPIGARARRTTSCGQRRSRTSRLGSSVFCHDRQIMAGNSLERALLEASTLIALRLWLWDVGRHAFGVCSWGNRKRELTPLPGYQSPLPESCHSLL